MISVSSSFSLTYSFHLFISLLSFGLYFPFCHPLFPFPLRSSPASTTGRARPQHGLHPCARAVICFSCFFFFPISLFTFFPPFLPRLSFLDWVDYVQLQSWPRGRPPRSPPGASPSLLFHLQPGWGEGLNSWCAWLSGVTPAVFALSPFLSPRGVSSGSGA